MSLFKKDKRADVVSQSPPWSSLRHRVGRDAAAWDDSDLFGDAEEEAVRGDDNSEKVKSVRGKQPTSRSVSPSSAFDKAPLKEATQAEPRGSGARGRQRQPPLSAASFLLNADGTPNDGLLSMYCNLNYSREKVHKYKFVERFEARDACRGECEKELRAAEAIITMNNRKQQWSNQPGTFRSELHERRSVEQEMLKASVILKRKQRQIARLAAEERLDLRNDLNTLLSEIREQLVTFYPYNEHLSRLARRLDKISTHQEMWAKYRPKLVQLHLAGFLQKWEDAGCPLRPHKLLQPTAPAEADNFNNDVEEVYMEEPFNFGGEKTGSAGPQIHEQQQKADGYPKATKGAQEGRLPQESGPSAAELEELRAKQREARARKEKLKVTY